MKRLPMRKIRDALRLRAGGLSMREIGASLGVGQSTICDYLKRAARADLVWPLPETLSGAALDAMLKCDVAAPLRTAHPIDVPGEPTASLLLMPAWRTGGRMGVKLVTVFPGNAARNERAVGAVYALFDACNGAPLALLLW